MFKRIFLSTILASSVFVSGCGMFQSNTPSNDGAKIVVSSLVVATSVLDAACAQAASETHDAQLAHDCAEAYTKTRDSLVALQTALDNNDKSFVCVVKASEIALEAFADVYQAKAGALPESVMIAESIARSFGAACKE